MIFTSLMRRLPRTIALAALAASVVILAGCATGGASAAGGSSPSGGGLAPVPAPSEAKQDPDFLKVGDVVIISFSGIANPPERHEERIGADGSIKLTYLGSIQAANMSRRELERNITDAYVPKYYQRLTVKVEPDNRFFYVNGEVRAPNRIPYLGRITVLQAISAAGDFTDFANRKNVRLYRGNAEPVIINCEKAKRDPSLDLEVLPNDRINVQRRLW